MSKGLIFGLAVLVILVVGGFFLFSGNVDGGVASGASSGDVAAGVEGSGSTPSSSGGSDQVVVIDNFVLPSLTVQVGDTLTWVNRDGSAHTATANDGIFDSDRLEKGESYSFTFTRVGTYDYFCAIHPSMKGTITVV